MRALIARLHRQQVARRSALFADGMAHHRGSDRLGGARPRAVLRRAAAACRRRTRWRSRRSRGSGARGRRCAIAVPLLPRIANFDDLDPLRAGAGGRAACCVRPGEPLPATCDLVILPGSKATHRRSRGAARSGLGHRHARPCRRGGRVLGLCGGYQMLGRSIADPDGIEGPPGDGRPGSGLLDVDTVLDRREAAAAGRAATAGRSARRSPATRCTWAAPTGPDTARPFARFGGRPPDGAVSRRRPGGRRPTCTACSPTIASARAWLARLRQPRRRPRYDAAVEADARRARGASRAASRHRRSCSA